jgi:hypothetical protein
VTQGTVDISVDDTGIWFLRTFGQEGRAQLLRRGLNDENDVEVAHDVRPSPRANVYRMRGDKELLAFATSEGLATWNKADSAPTMLSSQTKGVYQVALDADAIYFMGGDCILKKVPRAGGQVAILSKSGGERYCSLPQIAVDDNDVYFVPDETVYAVPRGGGPTRVVLSKRNRYVLGLAIDGDTTQNIYVLLSPPNQQTGPSKPGLLLKIPKRGKAAPVELGTTEPSGNAYTLVSDATHLYWLESRERHVLVASMTKNGDGRRVIAESEGLGYGIARGAQSIYWVRWIMSGGKDFPDVFRMTVPSP